MNKLNPAFIFVTALVSYSAVLSAADAPASQSTALTPVASTVAPAAANNPASAKAPATPPVAPPVSVPDNVNPFADKTQLPPSLNLPAPTPLSVDIHSEVFDGMPTMRMFIKGPDFEWMFDLLDDWSTVPAGAGESAAFIFTRDNPQARLSLSLYASSVMPEVNSTAITQYLAAVRASDPDSFVLLTPFAKDSDILPVTYFSSYRSEGANYAIVTSKVVMHHQWFVDLNHQYVLVMDLVCPPSLMDRLDGQVRFTLGRSRVRKGLGTEEPKPAPAPAVDTGTAPAKPSNN
ncbi:MAG TPA: hypothetical protein VK737_13230 [Opitutales bacterium]|nr:hypothetical protein [Opitutales bacterium]